MNIGLNSKSLSLTLISILILIVSCVDSSNPILGNFLKCLEENPNPSNPISEAIFTPRNASYTSVLRSYIRNQRFSTPKTNKPLAVVTATNESHVVLTVMCARKNQLQIRIRSGGHDLEGLSYRTRLNISFIILDMFNLRSIDIDIANESVWIQAGATVGELYYQIANKSSVHGFPSGICPTVATGGHFSGGGYGIMLRKYGLTIDNIVDAKIVDYNGTIHDRESMGEDVFWAIRGGGGASFGVILSWKIKLVHVPAKVTVFRLKKNLEQSATDIVYKWQEVAHKLDKDLFIRAMPELVNKTVQVSFIGHFLGKPTRLLKIMNESFPKLGLRDVDCIQMSWLESNVFWSDLPPGSPTKALLDRTLYTNLYVKIKSDYLQKPIPKAALEKIWEMMIKSEKISMQWTPYGGRMDEIPASATPFPHRKGNLFIIEYVLLWAGQGDEKVIKGNEKLMREFYKAMTPYVSNSPRRVFTNYRDLEIGSNPSNYTYYTKGLVYGHKYYNDNLERLIQVKSKFDPSNFFKHEQSIPIPYWF